MNDNASTSRLLIHYPPQLWLGNISKKFPFFNIQIIAFVPISHEPFIGHSLIQISGINPYNILEAVKVEPSLIHFSVMKEAKTEIVLSTQTKDEFLLRAIIKNMILVSLPVKVYDGKAEFRINGERSHIDGFIQDLANKGMKIEILQLGGYTKDPCVDILTVKQYEIYQKVRSLGYYDSPRQISLTELAEKLEVAKSSLSTMLQRIHKKLLGS